MTQEIHKNRTIEVELFDLFHAITFLNLTKDVEWLYDSAWDWAGGWSHEEIDAFITYSQELDRDLAAKAGKIPDEEKIKKNNERDEKFLLSELQSARSCERRRARWSQEG